MSSIGRKLSKSIGFQFINLIVNGLLGILIVPFILDSFGIEKYGVFELILSLLVIDTFLELGVGSTVVKYTADFKKRGGQALNIFFWSFTFFKGFLSMIAFFIVFFIAFNFELIFSEIPTEYSSEIKLSCIIFGLGLILKNIFVVRSLTLRGLLRYDYAISSSIIAKVAYFTIVFILLKKSENFGLPELSFMMFIFTPIITGLFYTFWLRRVEPSISLKPKLPDIKILKETIRFMGGMTFISLMAQVFGQGNRAILGMITNPVSVAIYGIAYKIRSPMLQLSDSILRPLIPAASSLNLADKKMLPEKIKIIARLEAIVIMGMAGIIILVTPSFVDIWLSGRLPESALVLQVWLLPFLLPRSGVMLMFYYGQGKTKASIIVNSINTAMSLLFALVLGHYYDVLGFILGIVISLSITSVIYIIYFCKYYSINVWVYVFHVVKIPYAAIAVSAVLFFALRRFVHINSWLILITISFIILIVYSIVTFALLKSSERARVFNIINPFSK